MDRGLMFKKTASHHERRNRGRRTLAVVVSVGALTALIGGCESKTAQSKTTKDSVTCFGHSDPSNTFPARALKNRRGAERVNLPPNRALASWMKTRESKELGYDQSGWIRLSRTKSLVKFGLPSKSKGLIAQADVEKANGRWTVRGNDCNLTHVTPGRIVLTLYEPSGGTGAKNKKRVLVETRTDLDGCSDIRPDFSVTERAREIRILATYPWDHEKQRVEGSTDEDCAGSVRVRKYSIPLEQPLAKRRVVQSGFVPARSLSGGF